MANLSIVEDPQVGSWNDAIAGLPRVSPFLSADWLQCVAGPGRRPICLWVMEGSRRVGAAAGLIVDPALPVLRAFGRRLYFYSGPALDVADDSAIGPVVDCIVDYAARRGLAAVTFGSWSYPYSFEAASLFYKDPRQEYVVDLRGSEDEICARMRSKIRQYARKAVRDGLTFQRAEGQEALNAHLRHLEDTQATRMSKGHGRYSPFPMPHLTPRALPDLYTTNIARLYSVHGAGGATVCTLFVLVFGGFAHALTIGATAEGYELRAPIFAYFETIKTLRQEGVRFLSLGGVPHDGEEGLVFLKESLGAQKCACPAGSTRLLCRSLPYRAVNYADNLLTRRASQA